VNAASTSSTRLPLQVPGPGQSQQRARSYLTDIVSARAAAREVGALPATIEASEEESRVNDLPQLAWSARGCASASLR